MPNTGEGRWLALPAGVIGNRLERNDAGLAHLAEKAHCCALVLDLMLGDEAPYGQGIEDLPNSLGIVLSEQAFDYGADVPDLGPGAAMPFGFYVARYINGVGPMNGIG